MSRWLPDLCAFFNEIALGSSLFPNFAVLMEKLLSYIFKPVRENMLFFLALMAAMLMPNVTMNGIGALRNLYLFACATMQSCFLAYVLCLLVTLISNRTAKIIVEIVLLLPFAVIAVCDTGSLLATKNLISWMSVSLIMETTTGEAAGFLRQFMRRSTGCCSCCSAQPRQVSSLSACGFGAKPSVAEYGADSYSRLSSFLPSAD